MHMVKITRLLGGPALLVVVAIAAACGGAAATSQVAESRRQIEPATEVAQVAAQADQEEMAAVVEEKAAEVADEVEAVVETEVAQPTARTGNEKLARDLEGITGWINSEPFTLESQRGKVVLVDFWTYTCINCIRTLPYLKDWHNKYADQGLVIVGVHSPEFDFEKIRENVVEAMRGFEIEYAVAQDNDFATWRAYNNRYWPAKYLIDKDGYIRYTHFGEGAYDLTEEKIRELLVEAGTTFVNFDFETLPVREVDSRVYTSDPENGLTRELYAGHERNYAAVMSRAMPPYVRHDLYYAQPNVELEYKDPGDHENHFLYLEGLWHNGAESLVHARKTENYEDYLAILFTATSVNTVMGPGVSGPYQVRVTIDDLPLHPSQAGADIMWDEEGNSYLLVDESRMYRVVEVPELSSHGLKLSSNSDEFEVFAYTFGAFKGDVDS